MLTTMHIERPEGTTIFSGLAAQYDLATPDPKADMGHAGWSGANRDYVLYDVYLDFVAGLSVRRRDVLVDDLNVDPLTNANVRMRVVMVEQFDQDHFEARCEQIIGT